MLGIDLSNFQAQFSRADAAALFANGIEFAFIGRQWQNITAEQQRDFLRLHGIKHIGEYLANVGTDWPRLFPETRYVAVDVESGTDFETEQDIDNALIWIRQQQRIPVIYSSAFMWDALNLGAVTKYGEQGILLWDAHYDGRTDGFELPVTFGGWTRCDIDQYSGNGRIPGIAYELDLNACRNDLWDIPPRNAEFVIEEEDVQTRPLDQSETIAAFGSVARDLGLALNDNQNLTWVEVIEGSPVQAPEGGHVYLVTTKG